MLSTYRHLVIKLFSFLAIALPLESYADSKVQSEALKLPGNVGRLSYLQKTLAGSYRDASISDLHFFLREAKHQKNGTYTGKAYFLLINHYAGADFDSMRFYIREAEPVFIKEHMMIELCRSYMGNCFSYANSGNKEKAMAEVRKIQKIARQEKSADLMYYANMSLAVTYFRDHLRKESIQILESMLKDEESRKAPMIQQFSTLRQLINEAIVPESRIGYLKKMEGILSEMKEKNMSSLDEETSISDVEYLYNRSLAQTYLGLCNRRLSKLYLDNLEQTVKKYHLNSREIEVKILLSNYYELIGESGRQIATLDTVVNFYMSRKRLQAAAVYLEAKGNAEIGSGDYKDAALSYKSLLSIKDSINEEKYYTDLAQMKAELDVHKLEAENRKAELDHVSMRMNMLKLYGALAVSIFLIACILILYLYQRKMSRKLKEAKELAEQNERMKSDFLANMNHEIRTPLNAVVGFSQIMAEEDDANTRQQYAEIIDTNNEMLQRLITDVLDISKIESNHMSFNYKEVDLPQLMGELYRITELRMREGVKLELSECTPLVFRTDPIRLMQIITNLLNNAIKHTNKGFIRFGYELVGVDRIAFSVKDSGEGIAKEKIDTIFSRFVKLDDWSKGVGLGLAICKGLVVKMRGMIDVRSVEGEGSTFTVILPLNSSD